MLKALLTAYCLLIAVPCTALVSDFRELVQYAYCHNPAINALRNEAEAARAAVKQQGFDSFSPDLNLFTGGVGERLTFRDHDRLHTGYPYGFLGLEWNLFSGGADVQELKIRQQEYCWAELELQKAKKKLAYDIAKKYYNLLFYECSITTYDSFLETIPEYLSVAGLKRDCGMTTELDYIEFEILQREQLEARSEAESLYHIQLHELAVLLGGCLPDDFGCIRGEFPPSRTYDDFCHLLKVAIANRDDFLQGRTELQILCNQYRQAFSGYLPSVDLIASYGAQPNIPGNQFTGTIGWLNISIPLGSWASTCYERKKIAHQRTAQQCSLRQLENTIAAAITMNLENLRRLDRQQSLATEKFQHVEKYWTLTREEYDRGLKNSPDVAGAVSRYVDTKVRLLSIQREYAHTLIDLAEILGQYP